MAELQEEMLQNGQELQSSSVNRMGAAALIDDRVLADALRLALDTGSGVAKAVLPFGLPTGDNSTVAPSGAADGSVVIHPFRAVVGSRTLVTGISTTDGLAAWRDIRSGVFSGGADPTTNPAASIVVSQLIAANSSGNARWDVIYAIVQPDAAAVTAARAVKSPTSGVVTTPTTTVALGTKVSLGYAQGTPSANPVVPALPVDTATTFYVALASVVVPNGFNAGWPVKSWMINPQCSPGPAALSRGLGGANLTVPNAIAQSTSALASWATNTTSTSSGRPAQLIPPEARGREDLLVAIHLPGTNPANWSHVSGALVDGSRDWRGRVFKTTLYAGGQGFPALDWAWSRLNTSDTSTLIPDFAHTNSAPEAMAGNIAIMLGQSFRLSAANLSGGPVGYTVCAVNSTNLTAVTTGLIALYVDDSTGALRVFISGAPNVGLFAWVESSGPFANW